MKWHDIFTMSSAIPSLGCLLALFRVKDPGLALLTRATSGRQTLFGICDGLFGYLWKKRQPNSLTLVFFNF